MYFELIDTCGWEKLQEVIGGYRSLKPDEHSQTDEEKWDQWLVRYSRAVNKNLGPFFVKWKVPVSEKALASVRSLPHWMHSDFKSFANERRCSAVLSRDVPRLSSFSTSSTTL
ncbi:MAG TPA: M60 family metallopeptidase [Pirellulales bacterium]|jgi:hypothetical protein|nr:M60 family metallopeptidase [Pirellulales bacterium]